MTLATSNHKSTPTNAASPAEADLYDRTLARRMLRAYHNFLIGSALLVVLLVVGSFSVPGFLSSVNLRSMLLLAAFLGLASLGQTLCALLGTLDLSIASVIGASNIGLAALLGQGLPPAVAIPLVLLAGAMIGLANGALSFRLQGQALILTLGVGFAVVGGTQILTSIGSVYAGNVFVPVPAWLTAFASMQGSTFGIQIPPVVVTWLLVSVFVVVFMARNRFGRAFYAVGGNRTAATRLSISERRYWIAAHVASGAMAALTGMLMLGFSGGGFVDVGEPYFFTTVAAVVIGGTSLLGGRGGYGSTVVGVLLLTVLTSLLVGVGFSYAAQQAVFGILIVPMVALYARNPHIRLQI